MNTRFPDYNASILSQDEIDQAVARGRRLHSRAVGQFGSSVAAVIAKPFKKVAEARRRRQTISSLSALSDRMLSDVGLDRTQIWAAAAGHDVVKHYEYTPRLATVTTLPVEPTVATQEDKQQLAA